MLASQSQCNLVDNLWRRDRDRAFLFFSSSRLSSQIFAPVVSRDAFRRSTTHTKATYRHMRVFTRNTYWLLRGEIIHLPMMQICTDQICNARVHPQIGASQCITSSSLWWVVVSCGERMRVKIKTEWGGNVTSVANATKKSGFFFLRKNDFSTDQAIYPFKHSAKCLKILPT